MTAFRRRPGYTLIELLVVIAIIGVLAGLLLAAVQKVRSQGQVVALRADLDGLSQAVAAFHGKFHRNPPWYGVGPQGTFRLCSEYPPNTVAAAWPELVALQTMFPQMDQGFNGLILDPLTAPKFVLYGDATVSTGPGAPATWPPGPGGLPVTKVPGPIMLDPNQCLVFFLSGGERHEYLGFSTNPRQPFTPGGPRLSGMPFFEFKKERLKTPVDWLKEREAALNALPNAPTEPQNSPAGVYRRWEGTPADTLATISNEPWFLDPWETPYLYTAASGIGSGGDYASKHPVGGRVTIAPWGGRFSGMNRAAAHQFPNATDYTAFPTLGPVAFKESANKWVNHAGFQVVSAGPNGSTVRNDRTWGFGLNAAPTGIPAFGAGDFDPGKGAGGDDFANFRKTFLGAPD